MKMLLQNRWLLFGLRLMVGAVFMNAGMVKIRDPQAFAHGVAAFHLLPPLLVYPVAQGLPWLELICGVLLVGGWRRRDAAFSLLVLSALFTVVLSQAMMRGLKVDCGCFGSAEPASLGMDLGRDLLMMAALALIYGNACLPHRLANSQVTD